MPASSKPCTGVVIVAAGSGTRLGAGVPKAFVELGGETLLAHALRGLTGLPGEVAVAIAVPAADAPRRQLAESLITTELAMLGERLVHASCVDGGKTRSESVAAALTTLPDHCDVVLVHDAARALTPATLVAAVAGAVRATGHGIVPALPVVDTLKQVDASGRVLDTADREVLRAVQTPQGFPAAQLRTAYAAAGAEATDDAGTFAAAGGIVEVIAGDDRAFKVTTPADLARAERAVQLSKGGGASRASAHGGTSAHGGASAYEVELRVGIGTDVHAFDDTSPCWLAGLHFPGERGLSGHSDGDAAAHALVDALLGAAGLGDIGSRFGVDDPRYANASGETFLIATRDMLADAGFRIRNASVQVICQRPRFGDRRLEAGEVLSAAIGAPVSVSATTSDRLGFTGREEGVFAVATALVERAP
ncbi:2-C-methyl-D-erythritol 2,4-cyclodiphosphate synthase [Gulosibacter macacae]|uniref:Bifunctional enzyme IspD/IspF n=1 Tax=Gulosibacter macacae TaxID=2488791 RepID=A0A3P3W0T5_9MICO|nr:2-C-methyl-D-erythritol 4-phosphate cytidylyltransferase [Gulosibacter macacae]RRJ87496.1 2-C-methyl-D-erythritol 2,4-cyclodiphosphate synthase [Gulosibacter macacae]